MTGVFTEHEFQIHPSHGICLLHYAVAFLFLSRDVFLYSVFDIKQVVSPITECNDRGEIKRWKKKD